MDYWKANEDIHNRMNELVGQHHPDLAICVDEIVVVFREKAAKSGGQVILGSSRRPSSLANALAGENYKFILEIGADIWEQELTNRQQEALLDHLLCGCLAEEDRNTGEIKCKSLRPDVEAYRANVERYGMWFPVEETEEEQPPIDPVGEMFGVS